MLFSYKVALLFSNIVNLVLVLSIALLFISGMTLPLRNILALLLRHAFYLRHLDRVALLLIVGSGEWLLHRVTLLSGFIPTLLFPYSLAAGNASIGRNKGQAENKDLHVKQARGCT